MTKGNSVAWIFDMNSPNATQDAQSFSVPLSPSTPKTPKTPMTPSTPKNAQSVSNIQFSSKLNSNYQNHQSNPNLNSFNNNSQINKENLNRRQSEVSSSSSFFQDSDKNLLYNENVNNSNFYNNTSNNTSNNISNNNNNFNNINNINNNYNIGLGGLGGLGSSTSGTTTALASNLNSVQSLSRTSSFSSLNSVHTNPISLPSQHSNSYSQNYQHLRTHSSTLPSPNRHHPRKNSFHDMGMGSMGGMGSTSSITNDSDDKKKKIIVAARFRPQLASEIANGGENIVSYSSDDTVILKQGKDSRNIVYRFDKVFSEVATQQDVFDFCGTPAIEDLFEGLNGVIFSYGQTGAGKTWSVFGRLGSTPEMKYNDDQISVSMDQNDDRGIGPRVVSKVFEKINQISKDSSNLFKFSVKISFYEIYLEKVYDLLDNDAPNAFTNPTSEPLPVKMDSSTGGFIVQGLTEFTCHNIAEVMKLIIIGNLRKKTASTSLNRDSSRSHTILSLKLSKIKNNSKKSIDSTLNIVDLAGNENTVRSNATGERMTEAKYINKSLSTLGKSIFFLTQNKKSIPFRESKLTKLLSEALLGRARTILLINCSPSSVNTFGTLSTLRFGVSAKNIKPRKSISLVSKKKTKYLIVKKKLQDAEEKILYLEESCRNLKHQLHASQMNAHFSNMNETNSSLLQEVNKWKQQVMVFEDEIEDYKFDIKREEAKNLQLTKKFEMKESMFLKQIHLLESKVSRYEKEIQRLSKPSNQITNLDSKSLNSLQNTITLLKYDYDLLLLDCKSLVQEQKLAFHDAKESLQLQCTSRKRKIEKENITLKSRLHDILQNMKNDIPNHVAKKLWSLLSNETTSILSSHDDEYHDYTNDFLNDSEMFNLSSDDEDDLEEINNIPTEQCGTVQLRHIESEDSDPEWKSRWLVLDSKGQILKCYKSVKSPIAKEIQLSDVKEFTYSIDDETITFIMNDEREWTFKFVQQFMSWFTSIQKYTLSKAIPSKQ